MTRINKKTLIGVTNKVSSILPVFFWTFLFFGFEEPIIAILSLGAALIHEAGHIGYILINQRLAPTVRGVIFGFTIRSSPLLSYEQEIRTYFAGPLINIICFVLFSFLSLAFGEICCLISLTNLATALSNLLPVEGYDGYGILRALIYKYEMEDRLLIVLRNISSTLIFLFCILSLYLIERYSGGYWIFAVFFISMIKHIKLALEES